MSLYAGLPPLLVVGSSDGDLLVLEAPAVTHANRGDDAAIPPGSLTRGVLRAQYPITAIIAVSPAAAAAAAASTATLGSTLSSISDDGTFWLFAACADKGIRRYRMLTDAQRAAVKSSHVAPKSALLASQNYQVINSSQGQKLNRSPHSKTHFDSK